MIESTEKRGFDGLTVAAFESRMGPEMTRLISRFGGNPLVAAALQEIPLENNVQALEFGERVLAQNVNLLILLTGVGTRFMFDVWKTRFSLSSIIQALSKTTLVARGPKPIAVLKELGLTPQLVVPEPNTWQDILITLDEHLPNGLQGLEVGVQEYGVSNTQLLEGLKKRGAIITPIPIYRWELPQDLGPLKKVLHAIVNNKVDCLLITNAAQVDHIFEILEQEGQVNQFHQALNQTIVASIGQITSERLKHHHLPVDFEPSHSKMGIMVKEVSEHASALLCRKRQQ